jgi:hypothetical protein
MIIREEGIVVGFLDDVSLKLTESTSDRLDELIKEWREDGLWMMMQGEENDNEATSNEAERNIPFTAANLPVFETHLFNEGFDVQTE